MSSTKLEIDSASEAKRICTSCKEDRPDQAVEQFCDCFYHYDCLKTFVNSNQKSGCPACNQPFTNCKIIKVRRPFLDFLFTTEICASLIILILIFFYCLHFFVIICSQYAMSTKVSSKSVQMFIIIPGIIYILFFIFCNIISCVIIQQQYRFWSAQNYTLLIM